MPSVKFESCAQYVQEYINATMSHFNAIANSSVSIESFQITKEPFAQTYWYTVRLNLDKDELLSSLYPQANLLQIESKASFLSISLLQTNTQLYYRKFYAFKIQDLETDLETLFLRNREQHDQRISHFKAQNDVKDQIAKQNQTIQEQVKANIQTETQRWAAEVLPSLVSKLSNSDYSNITQSDVEHSIKMGFSAALKQHMKHTPPYVQSQLFLTVLQRCELLCSQLTNR